MTRNLLALFGVLVLDRKSQNIISTAMNNLFIIY